MKNINNQHLEWNHVANQSKALKWLPRHTVSKTASARSLCFENMASASHFVPLELLLNEFIEEQSNKNTLSKTNRDVSLLKEFLRAKEVNKEILKPVQMESNFLNILRDRQKQELAPNPKIFAQLNQKILSAPGSDRDPVQAYHLYASKRPDQMKSDNSLFYLAINYTRVTNSSKPWFKAAPMGSNKSNSLTKTMAEKAGLNAENLTNHSARKQIIQKLNDHEVPPTHIMQISEHKNVHSLNNYSSLLEKQQRDMSNIMRASTSASGSLAIQETEEVSLSTGNQQSLQQALSLFQEAHIQGGTFNISINSVRQQSPNLSLHSAKRRHYMIESDSD